MADRRNAAIAAGLAVEYLIIGRTISATDEANREAAWRTLSPQQKTTLETAAPVNQCLVVITTLVGDVESKYFAEQFREPLLKAGWDVGMSVVTTPADIGFGLQIPGTQGNAPLHSNAIDPLIKAIDAAGLDGAKYGGLPGWAMETRRGGNSNTPFKACLFVGPKPPLA